MDITGISQIANSPAAYLIIAIIVSITFYKFFNQVFDKMANEKKEKDEQLIALREVQAAEAKAREERLLEHNNKLLTHLERSNVSQERTAEAIERINDGMVCLNERLSHEISMVHERVDDLQESINNNRGGIQ